MKRIVYILILSLSVSFISTSCWEKKSTGEKIEESVEDVGDEIEDKADDVKDAIDN